MSESTIGPGNMLDVINAAINRGAKSGDVLTVTDSDGNSQTWTLGETIPAPSHNTLVAFAIKES